MSVISALLAVITSFVYGTIVANPKYLVTFLTYFVPSILAIIAMMNEKNIMLFIAKTLKSFRRQCRRHTIKSERNLYHSIKQIGQTGNLYSLLRVMALPPLTKLMMYLHENEVTNKIKIVSIL